MEKYLIILMVLLFCSTAGAYDYYVEDEHGNDYYIYDRREPMMTGEWDYETNDQYRDRLREERQRKQDLEDERRIRRKQERLLDRQLWDGWPGRVGQ